MTQHESGYIISIIIVGIFLSKEDAMRGYRKTPRALVYAGRAGLIILTLLLAVVIALYSLMLVLAKGPSPTARDLFVRSVMETSAAKFLARMFFSEDEINEILDLGDGGGSQHTNTDLINIGGSGDETEPAETLPFMSGNNNGGTPSDTSVPGDDTTSPYAAPPDEPTEDDVEVVDVDGDTYKGKMIIIKDPSRVKIGMLDNYGEGYSGKTLRRFIEDEGAVGGINAGGFWDEGGSGTGSVPDGVVIRGGEIVWGSPYTYYKCVIGFDKNHILHVGNMTGAEALADGIVDGLSFEGGPLLVVNGVPETSRRKLNGGLNPRTAIGQRADGAILMLVINGRQADSLGATHADTCNIMASFGAVNAANLDGGSSSLMIYNGETLTQSAYFFGERKLPDVFLIMPEK